jgi:glycosyltransferase involved in cell wall biosynthesis
MINRTDQASDLVYPADCLSRAPPSPRTAVILPCFNEGRVIATVVEQFRGALPNATIYVFDNASNDDTSARASEAGAIVRLVRQRGKGNVIRQAFAQVEADVYLLADGDGTYDATRAPEIVSALWREHLDMVVATRDHDSESTAYREGHQAGNWMFNLAIRRLFAKTFVDIFSGYRALSRPFVKSFPALATGFETETEMSLHAIQLGLPCLEIATYYRPRDPGSESKLKTYRDGIRILWFIMRLLKHLRPLFLFSVVAALSAALSVAVGLGVIVEFIATGLVPRLPTALAAASLMIIAVISLMTGAILDGVAYTQQESKRLAYLSIGRRAPRAAAE